MNRSPLVVASTLPGCGSPCSNCSTALWSTIVRLRSRSLVLRSSRSTSPSRGSSQLATSMLCLRDAIREVRTRHIEGPHAGVQPLECARVVGWRDVSGRRRFVVGPQRDHEAVTLIGARRHSRIEGGDRALGFGEPLSKLDFEPCNLTPCMRHAGKDVTREQAQRELVRVLKNDGVADGRPSAEAVDMAAATARRRSDASIFNHLAGSAWTVRPTSGRWQAASR
jgi:hypothetical protein